MKSLIIFLLGTCLLFTAGCRTYSEHPNVKKLGAKDGVQLSGTFASDGLLESAPEIDDPMRKYSFRVLSLRGKTEANGTRRAQAEIRSNSSDTIDLQYRFAWLDAQGFSIDAHNESWSAVQLQGKATQFITGASPSPNAKSFKLHIRKLKFSNKL